MAQLLSTVMSLTENLLQKQQADYEETIEILFSHVCGLEDLSKIKDAQLEACAIQLWNWTVTKKQCGALSPVQTAKVRHIACSLLYCCAPENPTEGVIRKQIMMASKTGRNWLECKNPQMADHFLRLAVKCLEILYNQLMSRGDSAADSASSKVDVEKDLLRILSCQAESAMTQGNNQEAMVHMRRCRDILQQLPKETAYLSLMCYNFGIENYNLKKFEDSTFWLRESYDIGKSNAQHGPGSDVLAKILRLLATVYLEWDCQKFQDKALNAVNLSIKECVSTPGLYLKLRILLSCGAADDLIIAGLNEMLESPISLQVCLNAVKLLVSENRELVAFEFMKRVYQHFKSSPDLGSAMVLHAELLLQRGNELLGKQRIEDILTGHYSGRPLTPKALKNLHVILWDQASKHFEASKYTEALQWYNYSLSFFSPGQMEPFLAKLQRNRASCFLQLQQLEKAKEAVKEAERCDPESIFTQFSVFKIAVEENNVEKAAEALAKIGLFSKNHGSKEDKLMVAESAASNLLSLAAKIALENGHEEAGVKALEVLCENSKEENQILMGLRCLVRLQLCNIQKSPNEMRVEKLAVLLPYLQMALQTLSRQSQISAEQHAEDAHWFRKIAWNTGLQSEGKYEQMGDFYKLSYQLSLLCPVDHRLLMCQRTCLLMMASTSLELSRRPPPFNQVEELTQVVECTQACWAVWEQLKASGEGVSPADPTDSLLLLYEFEARAKLNDPKVETLFQSALELENVEPKLLETMAALSMEAPAHFPLLCKKALRVALSLHKKQPHVDLKRCSECLHSLIQLSLPSGVSTVEARVLEEAWEYFKEALSIISAAPDGFPEMETLWLLTQAWNTGIRLYSLNQYQEAEKWCSLSMSFIHHLGSLRDSYDVQMLDLYSEILRRLDKVKGFSITEV